jgi:uncharacterized membrane protein YhaH (DUF805 family)
VLRNSGSGAEFVVCMTETVLQTQHVLPTRVRRTYFWSVLLLGVLPCIVLLLLNSLLASKLWSEFNSLSSEDKGFTMIIIAGFLGIFAAFKAIGCIVDEKFVSRRTVVFGFLGAVASVYLIVSTHAVLLFGTPIIAYFITLHYNYTLKKYGKANTLERTEKLSDPAS